MALEVKATSRNYSGPAGAYNRNTLPNKAVIGGKFGRPQNRSLSAPLTPDRSGSVRRSSPRAHVKASPNVRLAGRPRVITPPTGSSIAVRDPMS